MQETGGALAQPWPSGCPAPPPPTLTQPPRRCRSSVVTSWPRSWTVFPWAGAKHTSRTTSRQPTASSPLLPQHPGSSCVLRGVPRCYTGGGQGSSCGALPRAPFSPAEACCWQAQSPSLPECRCVSPRWPWLGSGLGYWAPSSSPSGPTLGAAPALFPARVPATRTRRETSRA